MRALKTFVAATVILLSSAIISPAQDQKPANLAAAPPSIVLLVHQSVYSGKSMEREKRETILARASDRMETPKYWIDLESVTGQPESLVFSPLDSYEELGQSNIDWSRFLAAHPDLAHLRDEIEGMIGSQREVVAVRRDDLGYLAESIDLSEARFMNVLEVHLFPGHEDDFAEAFKTLADAYTKIHADVPWVVYQVDVGGPAPTFLVFRPLSEIKQNDDLLSWSDMLTEAEGEQGVESLKKIARQAYVSTESNLYVVRPEMSHVSKSFAATDPDFWLHRAAPEVKSEAKQDPKASVTH
jgi:hypothetical protein